MFNKVEQSDMSVCSAKRRVYRVSYLQKDFAHFLNLTGADGHCVDEKTHHGS